MVSNDTPQARRFPDGGAAAIVPLTPPFRPPEKIGLSDRYSARRSILHHAGTGPKPLPQPRQGPK